VTVALPDGATEASLAALGAASIERVPLSLEDAVIDYLRGTSSGAPLLSEIGGAP